MVNGETGTIRKPFNSTGEISEHFLLIVSKGIKESQSDLTEECQSWEKITIMSVTRNNIISVKLVVLQRVLEGLCSQSTSVRTLVHVLY